MNGHELSLQVGGQFRDLQTAFIHDAFDLIRIGLALRRFLQIDAARIPGGDLHGFESDALRPEADGFEIVERGFIAEELGEEDTGAFDCSHVYEVSRNDAAAQRRNEYYKKYISRNDAAAQRRSEYHKLFTTLLTPSFKSDELKLMIRPSLQSVNFK